MIFYTPGMIKRKLAQADFLLVAANLIPVYGVWFLGWRATEAFIVYALETMLIGVITLLKMLVVTIARKKDVWYNQGSSSIVSGFFFMAFFTVHFGLFAAVQTAIFSQAADIVPPGSGMLHFFFHWYEYVNKDIAIMLGGFAVGYLWKSFVPFILNDEYKTVPLMKLMFQPYGRIFIQQFTVIIGSMFLGFGAEKAFILIFAAIKIFFEVFVDFDGLINKSMDDLQKDPMKKN